MAKLQALLRRSYEYVGHTVIVLHESLCYDLDKGVLQYGSQEIVLTRTEHKDFADSCSKPWQYRKP